MIAKNQSRQPVQIEIDSCLTRQADLLGLDLGDLLEEVLQAKLHASGSVHSASVAGVSLDSVYNNLIGEHATRLTGLRHCFRKK